MLKFTKLLLALLFFLNLSNLLYASEKIAFIDINYIINNSNIGKKTLTKLEKVNEKNKKDLELLQKKIKKENDEIQKVKNVISKDELVKKIDTHKKNIKDFNDKRSNLSKSITELKKKQTFDIIKKISPIVQEYMEEKSIDVVLKNETLYISKSNYDITKEILDLVNKKIK
jgi:outer membrane protein